MAFRGGPKKAQKVMVQPINHIFRYLQSRATIQVWLVEQKTTRMEGRIIVCTLFPPGIVCCGSTVKQRAQLQLVACSHHLLLPCIERRYLALRPKEGGGPSNHPLRPHRGMSRRDASFSCRAGPRVRLACVHASLRASVTQGFDEYMNLVLDDAYEVNMKTEERKKLGRILLKGENVTLLQQVS